MANIWGGAGGGVNGFATILAGTQTLSVVNANVLSGSIVDTQVCTVDDTLKSVVVVCSGGQFTLTGNAIATANVEVSWTLVQQ